MSPLPCDFRCSALLSLNEVSPSPMLLDPILLTLLATKLRIDSFKEIIYILSNESRVLSPLMSIMKIFHSIKSSLISSFYSPNLAQT